ncbi:MAG TPA: apolipoprotein N-acyltransferase [Verrucomicrobiae bacterium]|jgi:apolipoprotein N-acyltransferase
MKSPNAWRYWAAGLGGLLLSVAFAPAEIAGAAWVAPGLILFCALGATGSAVFRIGFVAGFAHFLSSLYWLLAMPFAWHGIPLAPGLAWILLSAYCAVFIGLWTWCCWKFFPGNAAAPETSILVIIDGFLATPIWNRVIWAVLCAAAWTALEYTRGLFLSGFPWNLLGVSQYRLLPIIQIASITGVYGVTFLVVWFSVAIVSSMLVLARIPGVQRVWADTALPMLVLMWVAGFGLNKCISAPVATRRVTTALVQPSIPQTLIFDPASSAARFNDVIALSEKALETKPDILIWPESAVPELSEENQHIIAGMLQSHPVWLLFCSDSSAIVNGATNDYNSSFLISPKGKVEATYHKRRLVIFGEYVPLVKWLPFLKWFVPDGDGFTSGDEVVPFNMTELGVNASPLICFEDAFPQEARAHAQPDTDFLVNLTNDGWFGYGPEQKQHAVMAVFRAVENGIPLIRCTNDGLTCWVDAQGRMHDVLAPGGSIYAAGFTAPEIPLRPNRGDQTFYNQHGDWFSWSCIGISLAALLLRKRVVSSKA